MKGDFRILYQQRPFWIPASRKFRRNFYEGFEGQISFKFPKKPKQVRKEAGKSLGWDPSKYHLTIIFWRFRVFSPSPSYSLIR